MAEEIVPVDVSAKIGRTRARVLKDLETKGFELPERPTYNIPKLPVRLVDWPDPQVMRLFVQLTRYQDYIHREFTLAEISERSVDKQLDIAKARHLARHWEGKNTDTVTIAKAAATLDDEVMELEQKLIERNAHRKLLGMLLDSTARDAAVVSREISRRIGREQGERRADGMNP